MNSVGTLKIVHIKKNLKKKKKERKPSCIPIRLCIHISISFVQQCHYFSLSTLIKKKKKSLPPNVCWSSQTQGNSNGYPILQKYMESKNHG